MNAEDIASALDFSGKTGEKIVDALRESGYLEIENGTYKIHDWYDYAGKLADRREADKNRKRGAENDRKQSGSGEDFRRNSDGNPQEIQRKEPGNPHATVPYPTVPNQFNNNTLPRMRAREDERDDGFQAFWAAYPRKSGDIREAFMEYNRVTETVPPETLIEAIKAQTDGVSPEDLHFLPSAEKWLRNRGWESKASLKSDGGKTNGKKPSQIMRAADYKPPKSNLSPKELEALLDRI